jgi:hypothetical protein
MFVVDVDVVVCCWCLLLVFVVGVVVGILS